MALDGGCACMNISASRRVLRFGSFEADVRAGELRKQGLKIKLQDYIDRYQMTATRGTTRGPSDARGNPPEALASRHLR